ncbi:hypothetical protein Dsin_018609 [Dipteronia sinensis]|uniref:Reverse transcriptase domain-containing protein n=1 Tax=Dipteronia sinensis TaxID=43782 RepID=A0AAE0A763_9ROSI|nr:hypothetical protein Dsin_018609 [Dipteronia sinensis]
MCSSQHGSPWIVLGDFNVSRSVGESIGGCSKISSAMEEFNDCLQSSELDDLRLSDFLPLVERCWREQVHGTMQYKLFSKLRNLKKVLKTSTMARLVTTTPLISSKPSMTILDCSRPVRHGIDSTLSNIIDKDIFNGQADFMGRDVTDDEIWKVCFSLHPNKAPAPDCFNAHFFKITWDIVGEDVISVVQEFFRCIGDNILLVQELMRNYHKDASCPRLSLKVDLMKAFDMVDWGFLPETLAAFHFPPKVIMWIKAGLTTPKFSISFNGELAGFFSGKRGLR